MLPITQLAVLTMRALALQALALYTQLPPGSLIARRHVRLTQCVAPMAEKLSTGGWRVPSMAGQPTGNWPKARLDVFMQLMARLAGMHGVLS